jgi:ribonuclease P protein component
MQWTFPRHLRLRRQADFDRVYQRRVTASDGLLIVHADASTLPHPRLGMSVSRKVGSAVVRNRWKRLIREAFRLIQHELPRGVDLVVRPQAGAEPALEAIRQSLKELAWRLARRLRRPTPPPMAGKVKKTMTSPSSRRGRGEVRSDGSRPPLS